MSDTAAIHVALAFDDNFWAPAYATMRSICLASKRRADIRFHLCHRPLTAAHQADLDRITEEFGATLIRYPIDEIALFREVAARARYNRRLTNIVYARLLFDRILPLEITRLVYLDCDTFVRGPIEELAELDLQGFPIAAAEDGTGIFIATGRDLANNRDLFDTAEPYFNAGLLVIDMAGWREARIIERLEAAMADGTMDRIYYDQDFLNLVFKANWLRLDPLWNIVDPRPAHQAFNPKMLHYTGERKPWNLVSGVAFARVYRHVMTNELFYRYWRHRLKRRVRRLLPGGRAATP